MRVSVSRVPQSMVVFAVAFAGTMAHVASAAAYIILVPLGGLAFRAVGRSPILGIVVAYTAIASGYDASPIPTPERRDLRRHHRGGRQDDRPGRVDLSVLSNWFFNIASSVLLALVITLVTRLVLSKRDRPGRRPGRTRRRRGPLAVSEPSARVCAGPESCSWSRLLAIVAVLVPHGLPIARRGRQHRRLTVPGRHRDGGRRPVRPGRHHVRRDGRRDQDRAADVPKLMAEGIKQMAPVLVLFFAIAQFLAYFTGARSATCCRPSRPADSATSARRRW